MKLISLNLENGLHIDRHMQFLRDAQADVYCFQELVEPHIERYAGELACPYHVFVPITIKYTPFVHNVPEETPIRWGVGIFSKVPLKVLDIHHFAGLPDDQVPECYEDQAGHVDMHSFNWGFPVVEIEIEGKSFVIATTHFPKATASEFTTPYQRECLDRLLPALKQYPDILFCGDFNAPRGMEIFDTLASIYQDNIPKSVQGTIDLNLHRNGRKDPKGLSVVIDGIFTTAQYTVTDFALIEGVSDHTALVAMISKQ